MGEFIFDLIMSLLSPRVILLIAAALLIVWIFS
jgi:hypothetical protein